MPDSDDCYEIIQTVIAAAFAVHKTLGSGFLETIYHKALLIELSKTNLAFESEKQIEVHYDNTVIGHYSADILVENQLILELKAVQTLTVTHEIQIVNYLAATRIPHGLLINFGAPSLQWKKKYLYYKPRATAS